MDRTVISGIFLNNWQQKLGALLSAVLIWLVVNGSITETKTIPNIPIRITNLPPDKTIVGLLPNRLLSKRTSLTLSGTKDIIQELEPGDLEVSLDASTATSNEWVVRITKKNLVSLNPTIDLLHHVTQVEHPELVLKLSPLVSAKVPINVATPIGSPPMGYELLDLWPQRLTQTVTGSEEELNALKEKGLELVLDLSKITQAELDAIKPPKAAVHDDEINFIVPGSWKKILMNGTEEEINDPEAADLRIDFLRKELLPVKPLIPVRVFYPLKTSDTINAVTHPLEPNDLVSEKNGIKLLMASLFVRDVSRLFLEIVSDNLEIDIVAAPKSERDVLHWSLEVIDPHELEDTYVAYLLINASQSEQTNKRREALLRQRFQEYMKRLAFYSASGKRLYIESRLHDNNIKVERVN